MSRITNDLNLIAEVAHHAPEDLFISILTIVGSSFFMFNVNSVLAIVTLVPVPIMVLWGLSYGTKMKAGFKNVREKIADINSIVENSIQGIREVKSYANETLEIEKFTESNTIFKLAKEKMYNIMAVFFAGMNFLRDFYYIIVIGAGVFLIYKNVINTGDLLSFILYIVIILTPIDKFVNFVEQLQQGSASFERFTEVMDIEPDIKDKKNAVELNEPKGQICFEDVYFKYTEDSGNILENINLVIQTGETVALVGPSGAGKSTLVSLIPRFYEPYQGKIKIDDTGVSQLKQKTLRENIGIVQQDVFLFDGTVKDNISYGKPEANDDEIYEAAKNANIFDFIQSLPDKFDTYVGERGVKLSGGQKQRISIARVFLKNPKIIIFDEATSSLDTESESLIHDAMLKLSKNRTTIIIAHRLSTIKHANNIIVLDNGKIMEKGSHQNLLDKKGLYYQLYSKNLF